MPVANLDKRVAFAVPGLPVEHRLDAFLLQVVTGFQPVFDEKADAAFEEHLGFAVERTGGHHLHGLRCHPHQIAHPLRNGSRVRPCGNEKQWIAVAGDAGQHRPGSADGLKRRRIFARHDPVENNVDQGGVHVETLRQHVRGHVLVANAVDPVFLAGNIEKERHGVGNHTVDVKSH